MAAQGEILGRAPGAPVIVRPLFPSDALGALRILEESPEASNWSKESLEDSAAWGASWVAELNGRTIGILIGRVAAHEFEILNLAVAKAYRRKGVARRLLAISLESARESGARHAFLEVRPSNAGAVALYEQVGFREGGRRKNYYHDPVEDALLFVFHKWEENP